MNFDGGYRFPDCYRNYADEYNSSDVSHDGCPTNIDVAFSTTRTHWREHIVIVVNQFKKNTSCVLQLEEEDDSEENAESSGKRDNPRSNNSRSVRFSGNCSFRFA